MTDIATSVTPQNETVVGTGNPLEATEVKEPKTWTLKLDGKERKVTREEDLIRYAQKGLVSDERFEEIAKGKKELQDFHTQLKANPRETIKALAKQIGVDPRQLSEDMLTEFLMEEMTPPKPEPTAQEKELESLRAKVKAQEDQEAQQAKTKQEQEFNETKSKYSDHYLDQIQSALDSVGFIKDSNLGDQAIADAAGYMLKAYDAGFDPEPADIAEHIKNQHINRVNQLLNIPDDSLFDFLPPEFIKRVGKHYFNKVKGGGDNSFQKPSNQPSQPKTKDTDKPMKMSELKRLGLI